MTTSTATSACRRSRWTKLHPGELEKEIAMLKRAQVSPDIIAECQGVLDEVKVDRYRRYEATTII